MITYFQVGSFRTVTEIGMGREQVAREIYEHSSRTQKPIIVIEAGGAPHIGKHDPNSDRSETYNRIKGYFTNADGGTIILKNLELLSFDKQSVLLRILLKRSIPMSVSSVLPTLIY